MNDTKSIKIAIKKDLFEDSENGKNYFINKIKEKIADTNIQITKPIMLNYSKNELIMRLLSNVTNNILIIYTNKLYLPYVINANIQEYIYDTLYIPLNIKIDDIVECISSYNINNIYIIDPDLSVYMNEIKEKIKNKNIYSFTEQLINDVLVNNNII
jgi:hypothetical protein